MARVRRFLRIGFNVAAGVSLLAFVATCGLWVRGLWVGDLAFLKYEGLTPASYRVWWVYLESGRETLGVHFSTLHDDGAEPRRLGYVPKRRWSAEYETVSPPANAGARWGVMSPAGSLGWQGEMAGLAARWSPIRTTFSPNGVEWKATGDDWDLVVPAWCPAVLTALLPGIALVRIYRRRTRALPGHCPACGYDLRATPDRCPECGRVAAAS